MSNFVCDSCGMVIIDCGKEGFKTDREIKLEKELEQVKNQYEAVVKQNKSLQAELLRKKN